jgi:peroxiredoxin
MEDYMKKVFFILVIFYLACLLVPGMFADGKKTEKPGEKADVKKFRKLYGAQKYGEALELVDNAVKTYGVSAKWLRAKYYALVELEKYRQAIDTIAKKEKLGKTTDYLLCMDIAGTFFKVKDFDGAAAWLYKAAQNGFTDYQFLENKEYKPIHTHPRFPAIIKKMKDNIGIGKSARDFTTPLLSGGQFSLSKHKGKVVLVDFWSTKCGPCVKEIPRMRADYARLKDKGYEIIGISLNYEKEVITKFLEKEKMPWLLGFSGKGWSDDTMKLYNIFSIPSTYLVDKKGVLRHYGLRGKELGEAVETLLKE